MGGGRGLGIGLGLGGGGLRGRGGGGLLAAWRGGGETGLGTWVNRAEVG